jgi:hypothetical protein
VDVVITVQTPCPGRCAAPVGHVNCTGVRAVRPLCTNVLTLADSRNLGDCSVFRDVAWQAAGRAVTSTFYLLSDSPVLAPATDGGPGYQCYVYRGASPDDSGGLLLVTTTVTPQRANLVDDIRREYGLPADAAVQTAPVPLDSGMVSVTLAGEAGDGEFSTAPIGRGSARQTGTDGSTFAVALTADGAALLANSIAAGAAVLHAQFDLSMPYVLDDVSVHIWCDAQAACGLTGELAAAGPLTPAGLVDALTAHQVAGATRTSARPLSADEDAALDALIHDVLNDVLPAALLDAGGNARPYDAALDQRLNLTLTASYPAVRNVALSADLSLPSSPDRVLVFDAAADDLLRHLEISASGDFAARAIASISVRADYAGTSATGLSVVRDEEAVLRPGAQTAVLSFDLATTDQRTVHLHVDVHYADGSAPYGIDLDPCDGDAVEIDLDDVGVLAVELALGAVDPTLGARALVELTCGELTGSVWLDGSTPTSRWIAIVRGAIGSYRWRVSWDCGGNRVDGEWQDDIRRRLVLDAPPALIPPSREVTLLSAGNFDSLTSILVEVRTAEGAGVTTLSFTAPDQAQTWTGGAPLRYQTRQTLVPTVGSPVIGAWTDHDTPVYVVIDSLAFVVTVVGALLGLGTEVRRAVVEFEAPDGSTPSVVLDPATTQATCTLRLVASDRTDYRYRVIASPSDGSAVRTGGWQSSSSGLIVLELPSAVPVSTPQP